MNDSRIMSFAELSREMARFSYRPGWRLQVYEDKYLGPMSLIIAPVVDGYDSTRTIDLGIKSRIPPHALRSPEDLKEWLLWRLIEVEVHECREMLRYGDELVDDPHAEG